MIKIILYMAAALIMLGPALFLIGLRIPPRPFAPVSEPTSGFRMVPLPDDLPAPVARYYRAILGEQMPVIDSAVISTRGSLRVAGITFPTRFRFFHDAGQGYRHYAELTLFGVPVLKINERYLNGRARMELPMGVIENEPKVDMAANLGLWGESVWLPSIYLTDPRVRWQGIDETTARLIVPFGDGEDSFTVFFDADTGLIKRLEALRYREAAATEKTLWITEPRGWATFDGVLVPSPAAVTWADEGTPWLVVALDDVVYNAVNNQYLHARGP